MIGRHIVAEGFVEHSYAEPRETPCSCSTACLTKGTHAFSVQLDTDSRVYGGDGWRDHVNRILYRLPDGVRVRIVVEVDP